MLRVAARRCRGSGVWLLQQDIRRMVLPCQVELITMHSFTMNQFPSELPCVLERIWCNLCPGAFFLFDLLTPRQYWVPRRTRYVSERILRGRGEVCMAMTIRRTHDRKAIRELHCARMYEPAEMLEQLWRLGFLLLDALDALTLEAPGSRSPAILFLARKPHGTGWR
jgi:hypothetical protein